jgi:hypothetical protein
MLITLRSRVCVRVLFFALLLSTAAERAYAHPCSLSDLQSCSSCPAVSKVLDLKNPDSGEFYRGAFWNGLFAAYRLNCLELAQDLLKHGANPNLGGVSGSFLATIVQAWPHNSEAINAKWAKLVCGFRVDANWKNPWTLENAREIVQKQEIKIAYPGLWNKLSSNCASKESQHD